MATLGGDYTAIKAALTAGLKSVWGCQKVYWHRPQVPQKGGALPYAVVSLQPVPQSFAEGTVHELRREWALVVTGVWPTPPPGTEETDFAVARFDELCAHWEAHEVYAQRVMFPIASDGPEVVESDEGTLAVAMALSGVTLEPHASRQ